MHAGRRCPEALLQGRQRRCRDAVHALDHQVCETVVAQIVRVWKHVRQEDHASTSLRLGVTPEFPVGDEPRIGALPPLASPGGQVVSVQFSKDQAAGYHVRGRSVGAASRDEAQGFRVASEGQFDVSGLAAPDHAGADPVAGGVACGDQVRKQEPPIDGMLEVTVGIDVASRDGEKQVARLQDSAPRRAPRNLKDHHPARRSLEAQVAGQGRVAGGLPRESQLRKSPVPDPFAVLCEVGPDQVHRDHVRELLVLRRRNADESPLCEHGFRPAASAEVALDPKEGVGHLAGRP